MSEPTSVMDRVKSIIVEQLGVREDQVVESARFIEDLNADSLDIVEMIMDLESELGVELDMEDQKITTFKELADFIESKLN